MSNRRLHIKVCGMKHPANISEVSMLDIDYMGFIFYSKSPRFVGEEFVLPPLTSRLNRVGVFVNESTKSILAKAAEFGLNHIQLHGSESPQQCIELRTDGLKIIKVFSVDDEFNFKGTLPYRDVSDFFLFDTKGKYFGGNAKTFNWSVLNKYDQEVPFFLSGGLNEENLREGELFSTWNLHAVDVNSGVEDSPGLKNINAISKVVEILNAKP
jgi:phosphoribosylanthranilate isomerase